MATVLTEDRIKELLEDCRNGMGLQKAAKKYSIEVSRLRKIEKEKGLEVAILSEPLRIQDVEEYFQETRESFATLQKQIVALESLVRQRQMPEDMKEELSEGIEELQEKAEVLGFEINWEYVIGVARAAILGIVIFKQLKKPEESKPKHTPPTYLEEIPKDLPKKKSKLKEME